jgi:hypothetical protein
VHGLLGIPPKQVGITHDSTHDSLLMGGTLVGVSLAAEPVPAGSSGLYRIAHSLSRASSRVSLLVADRSLKSQSFDRRFKR